MQTYFRSSTFPSAAIAELAVTSSEKMRATSFIRFSEMRIEE
jgi:hypothetical protein